MCPITQAMLVLNYIKGPDKTPNSTGQRVLFIIVDSYHLYGDLAVDDMFIFYI